MDGRDQPGKGWIILVNPGERPTPGLLSPFQFIPPMLGLFSRSVNLMGSYLKKLPYKMSQSRKRHIRERLKNVENTLQILNSVGIPLKALDKANMVLRYSNLSPMERYTFFSWKTATRKPIHMHPKYTKVEPPSRVPYGYD